MECSWELKPYIHNNEDPWKKLALKPFLRWGGFFSPSCTCHLAHSNMNVYVYTHDHIWFRCYFVTWGFLRVWKSWYLCLERLKLYLYDNFLKTLLMLFTHQSKFEKNPWAYLFNFLHKFFYNFQSATLHRILILTKHSHEMMKMDFQHLILKYYV